MENQPLGPIPPSAAREQLRTARQAHDASIIAVLWFLAELLKMSAQNQWRPLRSLPKPRWGVTEVTLISVAVLVGGVIGPHVLASHSNSARASWGLGAAVTVIVAACLFAAKASHRRRASRAWQR
jgi:Mn2+/Fe2+ NRAMP family transporter